MTSYFRFGGARVAMRAGGTLSYLLADGLGSTTKTVNGSGSVASSEKYYPFGATRSAGTVATDKAFTGHQREDADLYFMKARFYDPLAGRFLQPDTIVPDPANPQALNRYSYVYNNPLAFTDPSGQTPCGRAVCALPAFQGSCGYGTSEEVCFDAMAERAPGPPATPTCPANVCPRNGGGGIGFFDMVVFGCQLAPVCGDVLDGCTWLTQRDCVTWQQVPEWQQQLALVSFFSLVGFSRYSDDIGDAFRRTVARQGDDVARALVRSGPEYVTPTSVTFGRGSHGYRHVEQLGPEAKFEAYITQDIMGKFGVNPQEVNQTLFQETVIVDGLIVKYNVHPLPGGRYHVGTYNAYPTN